MSDDITTADAQAQNSTNEAGESQADQSETEQVGDQLEAHTPEDLDASDEKLAKKQAKKHGIDKDEALHQRFVLKNQKTCEKLWHEFNAKLIRLGHVVEPVLQHTPKAIRANFNFRPLTLAEYGAAQEALAKRESELDAEQVNAENGDTSAGEDRTDEHREATDKAQEDARAAHEAQVLADHAER